MSETTTITVRISIAARDRLDRLAKVTRRSRSYLAAEALEQYLEFELGIIDGIEEGIEDVKAGRVFSTEQVIAQTDAIIAAARKRKASAPAKSVTTTRKKARAA